MNTLLIETSLPAGQIIQLVQGDITSEMTGAIVNAANADLAHGAGVAGAIVRRGGATIQCESNTWVRGHGPVSHAEPAWTSGGDLPCRYVIHAVGPVWGAGEEDVKLAAAVTGSLRVADRLGLVSLALPALSTGTFGFPRDRAAEVIFSALKSYFTATPDSGLTLVRLVLFDGSSVDLFQRIWHDHFGAES
ncbi:MAG: macro domain-containing protein [Anaerolineales bacterium]|nr:macro domain-containing protein [Anaerolineales bacterium]